jgi:hypothetical protein
VQGRLEIHRLRLAAEAREEPEEKGQGGAQNEASDDWKVKSAVFAAMDDVAGEPAEAKRQFAAEVQQRAKHDKHGAEKQNTAAQFAQRIHAKIIREHGVEIAWSKARNSQAPKASG